MKVVKWLLFATSFLEASPPFVAADGVAVKVPIVAVTESDKTMALSKSALYNPIEVSGKLDSTADTVTLGVTDGSIKLAQTSGLSFTTGNGQGGEQTLSFSGTTASVNAALDGMTYAPATSFAGRPTLSVQISGSQTVSATLKIAVNAKLDPEAARTELMSNVAQIHGGLHPGRLVAYGPTAYNIIMYPPVGKKTAPEGPMIGAATFGAGRVIAMPDHQMLLMKLYGGISGNFYKNGVKWLAKSTSLGIKIVTYDEDSAEWLTGQGYTNVVTTSEDGLVAALAGAIVFVGGWMGSSESETNLEALKKFAAAGGGLFISDYGEGYDYWWIKDKRQAPGNLLLREPGLGFGDGMRWDKDAIDATTRATGRQITAGVVLAMLSDPSGYTADELTEGGYVMNQMNHVLPEGDDILARMDTAFSARINQISPTPTNPVTNSFDKAFLLREALILENTPAKEVTAHRTAVAVYGDVAKTAPRITKTIRLDTARGRWHATGLYAAPGQIVSVTVPQTIVGKSYSVRINSHISDVSRRKGAWSRPPRVHRKFEITSTTLNVANAFGGPIFIDFGGGVADRAPNLGVVEVQISNAVEHPFFVLGQHTNEEWVNSMRSKPAPYAVFVCRDLMFVQKSTDSSSLSNPTELMTWWQKVVTVQDKVAGYVPGSRTSGEMISVDVQISHGAGHSGYPIQAFDQYWLNLADLDSLKANGSWGDFHEIGHNHQRSWWTFAGDTEVTVNIFSAYCLRTLTPNSNNGWNYVLDPVEVMKRAATEVKKGFLKYDASSDHLLFWLQLIDGFGIDTMTNVFRGYEEDKAKNQPLPSTEAEKKDQWLIRFSRETNYDMTKFMKTTWKLEVSDTAVNAVSGLNSWMPAMGGIAGTVNTKYETPLSLDLKGQALSMDGVANLEGVTQSLFGTVTNSDGTYTYLPNEGFSGTDSFSYIVVSSTGHSHLSKVQVAVEAANSVPAGSVRVVFKDKSRAGYNGDYYPSDDRIGKRAVWYKNKDTGGSSIMVFYCVNHDRWVLTSSYWRQGLIDANGSTCAGYEFSLPKPDSGSGGTELWEYKWETVESFQQPNPTVPVPAPLLFMESCPPGGWVQAGDDTKLICTHTWTGNCGQECAHQMCIDTGGKWIPFADYGSAPHTCHFEKCPEGWSHSSTAGPALTCTRATTQECGDVCARLHCEGVGGTWESNSNSNTCKFTKCESQLHLHPGVNNWNEANSFCGSKGGVRSRIANFNEYCPKGTNQPPTFGKALGDQWVAISDDENGWVNVGTWPGNGQTCIRHRDLGGAPAWGADGIKHQFESNMLYCNQCPATPKARPYMTTCPPDWTQGRMGFSGNLVCFKSWTEACSDGCAQNICNGKGGTWIAKPDYGSAPFECHFSACPRDWTAQSADETSLTCTKAATEECNGECAKTICGGAVGTWVDSTTLTCKFSRH